MKLIYHDEREPLSYDKVYKRCQEAWLNWYSTAYRIRRMLCRPGEGFRTPAFRKDIEVRILYTSYGNVPKLV